MLRVRVSSCVGTSLHVPVSRDERVPVSSIVIASEVISQCTKITRVCLWINLFWARFIG